MEALADRVKQDIAQPKDIKAKGIFICIEVIVEIYPYIVTRMVFHDDMIVSDVAMLIAMGV